MREEKVKELRKLISISLLSVVLLSMFGLTGFIKPTRADPYPWGAHKIYVNYYKTRLAYDHDADVWPLVNEGEWYFRLYSAGGNDFSLEYSVDKDRNGWKTVDHIDQTVDYTFASDTYFKMWAGEDDGILGWDYTKFYTVTIPANWGYDTTYKPNEYHYRDYATGDVWFYGKFIIYNDAPTASPISDQTVYAGQVVSFTGSGSDPEGDSISYEWDFSYDGLSFNVESTEQNPTHYYMDPETYVVAFRVKDYFDAYSSIQTATITANPYPDGRLRKWRVSPSWHHGHPSDTVTLRAYVKNEGTIPVHVGVSFIIRDAAGNPIAVRNTQNVLLAPGESIDGKTDPRMTAQWTATLAGVYYPTGYLRINPDSYKKVRLGVK